MAKGINRRKFLKTSSLVTMTGAMGWNLLKGFFYPAVASQNHSNLEDTTIRLYTVDESTTPAPNQLFQVFNHEHVLQYEDHTDENGVSEFNLDIPSSVDNPINHRIPRDFAVGRMQIRHGDPAFRAYDINLPSRGDISVGIFNIKGEKVVSNKSYQNVGPGAWKLPLNLSGLISGTYFLSVSYNGKQIARRFQTPTNSGIFNPFPSNLENKSIDDYLGQPNKSILKSQDSDDNTTTYDFDVPETDEYEAGRNTQNLR